MLGEKNSKQINFVIVLACFLSVFSQLPIFVASERTQIVSFPIWIVSFALVLLASKGKIKADVLRIYIPTFIFVAIVLFHTVFTSSNYFSSSLLRAFLISLFVFTIGAMAGPFLLEEHLQSVMRAYIFATLIISIYIFINYFGFSFTLSSKVYAYASKNSVSQIIFTAILIMILKIHPEQKGVIISKWIAVSFEVILLMILRSRATIVGLIICIMILAVSKNTNKTLRNVILLVGSIFTVSLIFNNDFNRLIFNNILFAGRDASNLNSLSSGRVTIINSFPVLIKDNWLTGIGATYFECFPLSAILQFGLIPGLLMIVISVVPLIYSRKMSKISADWFLLYLLAVGYNLNSLFEGIAPFGPGIKCFFLWLLFGLLLTSNYEEGLEYQ